MDGLVAEKIGLAGAGLGEFASRGRKGQGYDGEEDIGPPELSGGAANGGLPC